jgi:anti-sigma B factor antagonist
VVHNEFNRVGGEIRCAYESDGGSSVVSVAGDVDVSTVAVLRRTLQAIATEAGETLVVDLRDVDFIAGVGLSAIVELEAAREAAGESGLELVVNRRVRRVLGLAGLDRRLSLRSRTAAPAEARATPTGSVG